MGVCSLLESTRAPGKQCGQAMTPEVRPGDGPNESVTNQETEALKLPNSVAKIQGFIGIIAITIGDTTAIVTHMDEIRQYVSKPPRWKRKLLQFTQGQSAPLETETW
jgi:hypothetical protein